MKKDYFTVMFLGKLYSLPNILHSLERDEIEYCIRLANDGFYNSVMEAAKVEFNL